MKRALQAGIVACIAVLLFMFYLIQTVKPAHAVQSFQYGLTFYLDTATGCQYIATDGNGGLVPRMAADGKQVCRQGAKP